MFIDLINTCWINDSTICKGYYITKQFISFVLIRIKQYLKNTASLKTMSQRDIKTTSEPNILINFINLNKLMLNFFFPKEVMLYFQNVRKCIINPSLINSSNNASYKIIAKFKNNVKKLYSEYFLSSFLKNKKKYHLYFVEK